MFTIGDSLFIGICLEGFFYGLYSGIFAIYLQGPSKESRTAMIIFYVLCLLYVLSTATFVCDFLISFRQIYPDFGTLSPQLQIGMQSMLSRIEIVQVTLFGCCDFITQFILIYRCWIVWGKNIRVVIIPSFLAIVFIATWLASEGAIIWGVDQNFSLPWGGTVVLTALAVSMAVNSLETGLIVFKILKVTKSTSVEGTLGSLSSNAGGTNLRHIIFIIVESGMALFLIQLVRIVVSSLAALQAEPIGDTLIALNFVISIHQILNGIAPTIIFVRVSERLSFDDDEESFKEFAGSLVFNNPPSDPNPLALQLVELESSSSNMAPQEKSEDICFINNSPSDLNSLRLEGSCSNTPHQERSEVERY